VARGREGEGNCDLVSGRDSTHRAAPGAGRAYLYTQCLHRYGRPANDYETKERKTMKRFSEGEDERKRCEDGGQRTAATP
jgi:hypothetical protein